MDETHVVNNATNPDGEPVDGAADGAPDESIVDLAWPVPLWTAAPLAVAAALAMAWAFGADRVLISVVPFVALLSLITIIDLRELRVPNALLKPAYIVGVPLLIVASTSDWVDVSLVRAVLGGLGLGAIYFLILFIYPPGMGWGDVKLAPLIGAQLALFGWMPFVRSLIISHFVSGIVAVIIVVGSLILRGRGRPKLAFPFAPFMAIGAIGALLLEAL